MVYAFSILLVKNTPRFGFYSVFYAVLWEALISLKIPTFVNCDVYISQLI
jgi:hypothetical protein